MFGKNSTSGYVQVLDKIERKTLVHGRKTLMCEFRLQEGAVIPTHSHRHEQTGYLAAGRLELTIGDEIYQVAPGDSWCIAGRVEHSVFAIDNSLALEVFSPVREDYLP